MKGTAVLSLDFELAWGHLDIRPLDPVLRAAEFVAAEGADRLLQLLVERELPATWATVGALLRDGWHASADLDEAHVNGQLWETPVPVGQTELDAPAFFAPTLGDRIQHAPGQELGFHGYTHLSFTDPAMTARRAEQELVACRAVAQERGIDGVSWVFPRNHVGHLDVLARHGIGVYRSLDRRRLPGRSRRLRLVEGLVADWAGLAPLPVQPTREGPLVALPGSTLLAFAVGRRRRIPDGWRLRRLQAGIRAAARSGGVFHAWFHPVNLYPNPERKLAFVEAFLDQLVQARDRGEVDVVPMGHFAR